MAIDKKTPTTEDNYIVLGLTCFISSLMDLIGVSHPRSQTPWGDIVSSVQWTVQTVHITVQLYSALRTQPWGGNTSSVGSP